MAHSLGGEFDLPHGECNALLLEEVVQYNYPASPDRYRQLAKAMHLDIDNHELPEIQTLIVNTIRSLRKNLGITQRLNSLGVSLSDIPKLAAFAYKDPCIATNPRSASPADIEKLYQAIYE